MYTVTSPAANRVDIAISGSLDRNAMVGLLDQLVAASATVTGGRMLYRITDFAMPELAAWAVEMQRLPQLFGLIRRFDRCAVISDAGWIRRGAEIQGALIPGLAVKSFTPDATDAAEAWLAGS